MMLLEFRLGIEPIGLIHATYPQLVGTIPQWIAAIGKVGDRRDVRQRPGSTRRWSAAPCSTGHSRLHSGREVAEPACHPVGEPGTDRGMPQTPE
jgi:hypothetical protein